MRKLKRIILHCTATEDRVPISVDTIRKWHTPSPRNWSDIGYHYVIALDGKIQMGRPLGRPGAHTKGENHDSVGVAYIGGLLNGKPHDTMTAYQDMSWLMLVNSLRTVFGPLTLHGHNEFANKACPSFVVAEKYSFLY